MKHVVRYLQCHFCNSIKNAVRNYWNTQWVMIMKIQDSTLPFPVKISKTIQTKRTRWKTDIHSEGRLLSSGSVPSIALIQPAHRFLHGSHWMSPTLYNGPRNAFKIALPLTGDLGSYLIHGSQGPKSTTKTACRSDQPFNTAHDVIQEEHPAWKKLSDEVLVWLSACSKVQIVCIWSSWCHCIPKPHNLLPHLNPDWFYLSSIGLCRLS